MRLIDADALRKCFEVPHELKCGIQAGMDEYALKCIDEQPTIAASPWHRVEEPPEENGAYLVWWNYKGSSYWFRGVFFDGRWLFEPGTPKPDYWMPIEPPKEEEP